MSQFGPGLRPLLDLIVRRRNALFGHVARLSEDAPAHQALGLSDQPITYLVALLLVSGDASWSPLQQVAGPGPDTFRQHPSSWSRPFWGDATVHADYAITTILCLKNIPCFISRGFFKHCPILIIFFVRNIPEIYWLEAAVSLSTSPNLCSYTTYLGK